MNVSEAYKTGIDLLKRAGNEAPAVDAGALLCSVCGRDRSFLYAHGTEELDDMALEHYQTMLGRRAEGIPLQYLIGTQEFMSLPFEVGPGVLIPRQDTELLVETVICLLRNRKAASKPGEAGESEKFGVSSEAGEPKAFIEILDIGTGSGCIAVSLAHHLPGCRVTAVDKMPEAIEIARRNAERNNVADRVAFLQSDLFDAIPGRRFDAIVSNPPYIRTEEIAGLQREVRCYEPVTALDGGTDGLDFYRKIIRSAPACLKKDGILAFETGYDQAEAVASMMAADFSDLQVLKDLAGIPRVVACIRSEGYVCIQNPI